MPRLWSKFGHALAVVTRLTRALRGLAHNADMTHIRSPLQAQIVQWLVAPGDTVRAGDVVVILEAMKMEHEVRAEASGRITELLFAPGEMVDANEVLLISEQISDISRGLEAKMAQEPPPKHPLAEAGPHAPRSDLQKLQARQAFTLDASRPEAIAKRHVQGLRSARAGPARCGAREPLARL